MEENRLGECDRESLRVQKTAYLRRQLARRRQEEDARWEQLVQEQQVIDRLQEDMDGDMDWMEESRRYHQNLKEDLNAQIYALHGVSADKLEGMREYGQAYYRRCLGCAAYFMAFRRKSHSLCWPTRQSAVCCFLRMENGGGRWSGSAVFCICCCFQPCCFCLSAICAAILCMKFVFPI